MNTSDLHSGIITSLKKCPARRLLPKSPDRRGTGRPKRLMIKKILYDTLTFIIIAAVLIALAYLAIGGVYSAISGQTFEQSLSAMWKWIVKK